MVAYNGVAYAKEEAKEHVAVSLLGSRLLVFPVSLFSFLNIVLTLNQQAVVALATHSQEPRSRDTPDLFSPTATTVT
jgi:hypothetical protein